MEVYEKHLQVWAHKRKENNFKGITFQKHPNLNYANTSVFKNRQFFYAVNIKCFTLILFSNLCSRVYSSQHCIFLLLKNEDTYT